MSAQGIDAYGAIPVSQLGSYQFVARYVSQRSGKTIIVPEAKGYLAAGKSIVLVYEDNATDGLGGAAMGLAKARIAAPILSAIGWPATRPVHFAFDMPGYQQDLPAFIACATAFARGINRPIAVYGDVDTCTYAHSHGIKYLWQFGEGTAPGLTIKQGPSFIAPWGQSVDPDTALANDYGQWSPTPPAPKPVPTEDEVLFLAKSFNGPATLLYDAQAKTCRGVAEPTEVALYEKVGIKNYTNTLDATVLAEFKRVG